MNTPLRPLTTAELLDRTFHLYRNNFWLFAGIATVTAGAVDGASLLMMFLGIRIPPPRPGMEAEFMRGFALYFGVLVLFYIVGASFATAATIYAVSKVHLGQLVSVKESYAKVLPRMGRIFLIVLAVIGRMIVLVLILFFGLVLVGMVFGLIFSGIGGSRAEETGYVMGLILTPVLYFLLIRLYLKYSLAVQACVLEDTLINESLQRSSFLAQGSLWRIFLIYLLMGVIGFALSLALHWPGILLRSSSFVLAEVWNSLATFVAYTLSFPISTIAISLVYYDQRVRKEALDLQLMMESLAQSPPDQSAAAPTAAPIG